MTATFEVDRTGSWPEELIALPTADLLWRMFEATGSIFAYLMYCRLRSFSGSYTGSNN